ncbi:hypothetical protein Q7C36_001789 [Tachysurus vachellii]|uniref:Uncharacterized protein n=1 Tax=Tachysurus vachellii TaxID=175792 RepID=A0AA88NRQ7_TACVA|nr:hypothetical protein Q7C36_001789 [Tachysurus vachellii]
MCPNSVYRPTKIPALKWKPFDKQNYILHPQSKHMIQKSTCLIQKSTLAFFQLPLQDFLFIYFLLYPVAFMTCELGTHFIWFYGRERMCIVLPGKAIAIPEVALCRHTHRRASMLEGYSLHPHGMLFPCQPELLIHLWLHNSVCPN